MKIAYFDCFAGAAGDMIAAAMLDAGLDAEFLKAQIATLGLEGLKIQIQETQRTGIKALQFIPVAPKQQEHRAIGQITKIIENSRISSQAKQTAIAIFNKLAEAEAVVHNTSPADVHFHEIGAVDSIVDIVSAAVGLEALEIDKVYCSTLSVGGGTVKCAHGILPVPAPATAQLIKGVPITAGPGQVELLTPTAAAILTTVTESFGPLPAMKVISIGSGAGTLQSDEFPNVLRLFIGEQTTAGGESADSIMLLETNVDDISGELIGVLSDSLLEAGALDVYTTPIYMKHNRPGVKISVICESADAGRLEQLIFQQGITFGIRRQILQRSKLAREFVEVKTKFGPIRIKLGRFGKRIVNAKPELADCVKAAKANNTTAKSVLNAAMAAYNKS